MRKDMKGQYHFDFSDFEQKKDSLENGVGVLEVTEEPVVVDKNQSALNFGGTTHLPDTVYGGPQRPRPDIKYK